MFNEAGPSFLLPGAVVAVRSEAKPEWQLLQLLLSHPKWVMTQAEAVDMGWFSDERVRDLFDHALALQAERGEVSLRELFERIPENLRDALTALEINADGDENQVRRFFADHASALEERHLRRELLGTTVPQRHLEIQKRIQTIHTRKGGNP